MRAAVRSSLRLGEQLHWGSEHPLLPAVPAERVCHGGGHRHTDSGPAAERCGQDGPHACTLRRCTGPAAAHGCRLCCPGEAAIGQ